MAGKSKYTFESKIHVYRATKRMTQQELADLVGVSRQTIMQLERNRYNPSMLLAYSIAKVFDVTIEDLFDFRICLISGRHRKWRAYSISCCLIVR